MLPVSFDFPWVGLIQNTFQNKGKPFCVVKQNSYQFMEQHLCTKTQTLFTYR
uniref:Uncharacterized protein n=1 Tax=Octopus bimaculoides TaxID=37653 RepID=A0A0L8HMA1_OCTBM